MGITKMPVSFSLGIAAYHVITKFTDGERSKIVEELILKHLSSKEKFYVSQLNEIVQRAERDGIFIYFQIEKAKRD